MCAGPLPQRAGAHPKFGPCQSLFLTSMIIIYDMRYEVLAESFADSAGLRGRVRPYTIIYLVAIAIAKRRACALYRKSSDGV